MNIPAQVSLHIRELAFMRDSFVFLPFTHICKPLDRKEATLFVSVTVNE